MVLKPVLRPDGRNAAASNRGTRLTETTKTGSRSPSTVGSPPSFVAAPAVQPPQEKDEIEITILKITKAMAVTLIIAAVLCLSAASPRAQQHSQGQIAGPLKHPAAPSHTPPATTL